MTSLRIHYFSRYTGGECLDGVNYHVVNIMHFKSSKTTGGLILNLADSSVLKQRIIFLAFNSLV